jgi:hypothetical protein
MPQAIPRCRVDMLGSGFAPGGYKQIFEARLEFLGAWICGVVGDMKKECVLWGGTALFLPQWFVLADKASFKK